MNAPTPALVAPRPERLQLVGQRRQMLAVMHQRLMFGMLVYAGIVALIALRILYLAAFGDHAGRKEELTGLIPDRGDIVDRNGEPLARTIDAWTIAIHPNKVIGDKLALAQPLGRADAGAHRRAIFRAAPLGQAVLLPAPPRLAGAGRGGQRDRRAGPGDPARARPALSADDARRACPRLHRHRRPWRRRDRARVRRAICPIPRRAASRWSCRSRAGPAGARARAQRCDDHLLGDRRGRRGHGRPHRRSAGDDLASGVQSERARATAPPDAAVQPRDAGRVTSSARPSSRSPSRWRWTAAPSNRFGQQYNCPNVLPAYGHLVHDTHPFGRICTVAEIMEESSNIGTAQIADQLGTAAAERLGSRRWAFSGPVPIELKERGRAADPGLALGSVRNHDRRLRPGHRGRAAAAGDGLCDLVRRRRLSPADDAQDRSRPSACRRASACSAPTPATACARCSGWW